MKALRRPVAGQRDRSSYRRSVWTARGGRLRNELKGERKRDLEDKKERDVKKGYIYTGVSPVSRRVGRSATYLVRVRRLQDALRSGRMKPRGDGGGVLLDG